MKLLDFVKQYGLTALTIVMVVVGIWLGSRLYTAVYAPLFIQVMVPAPATRYQVPMSAIETALTTLETKKNTTIDFSDIPHLIAPQNNSNAPKTETVTTEGIKFNQAAP